MMTTRKSKDKSILVQQIIFMMNNFMALNMMEMTIIKFYHASNAIAFLFSEIEMI